MDVPFILQVMPYLLIHLSMDQTVLPTKRLITYNDDIKETQSTAWRDTGTGEILHTPTLACGVKNLIKNKSCLAV